MQKDTWRQLHNFSRMLLAIHSLCTIEKLRVFGILHVLRPPTWDPVLRCPSVQISVNNRPRCQAQGTSHSEHIMNIPKKTVAYCLSQKSAADTVIVNVRGIERSSGRPGSEWCLKQAILPSATLPLLVDLRDIPYS